MWEIRHIAFTILRLAGAKGDSMCSMMKSIGTFSFVLALTALSSAQLTDLQPGPNFTSENSAQFGLDRSENIDVGDVDNDGDLDVIVGNGGDGGDAPNRIFINNGGLQGGTLGTFTEETSARFLGVPNDRSRDIEFADIDDDGDLDIYVSNRGTFASGGQPARFYINQGGIQGGTIGVYTEDTNARWGTLMNVPLAEQVFGGNQGPFLDHTCDCDFADLDDDGDLDLFHSSYGPGINGTRDSRVFLNDGAGIFHELWPWVEASSDTAVHVMDLDLMDMDGDYDIDVVMSSRDSQARIFMNNTVNGIGATLFSDITQTALLDTGAVFFGNANYESESADVDGDGDFDIWMKNYNGNTDRLLRNNGYVDGVGFNFTQMDEWIKGDPVVDENEVDFFDFDGDNDLDLFVANFMGTNYLYQNGTAQGVDPHLDGMFHRTGTSASGSLVPWPELPASFNGGTSLDADLADMDNDGDPDILISNDSNQPNRYFQNILGVPDTHAPTFDSVTVQADKPAGTSTVIHASIRDNSAYYIINYYNSDLIYTVDGGPETTVCMFKQGGQQARGVIPDLSGTIAYRIETTDLGGNTGVSATNSFVQGAGGTPWTNLGFALAGVDGKPSLLGTGSLVVGTAGSLELCNAAPSATAVLFISVTNTPSSFKGGTLVTVPVLLALTVGTGLDGKNDLVWTSWPTGLPPSTALYFQYAIVDAAAPVGVSLSNALEGVAP
jgi:hypothetical protein